MVITYSLIYNISSHFYLLFTVVRYCISNFSPYIWLSHILSFITYPLISTYYLLSLGTVLATSAEDGQLSLYRKNFAGEWVIVQTLASTSEPTRAFYKNP